MSFNRSLSFQMAYVLSVSRRQLALVKCGKMARFFEKLILVVCMLTDFLCIISRMSSSKNVLTVFS